MRPRSHQVSQRVTDTPQPSRGLSGAAPWWRRDWLAGALLVVALFVVYRRVWRADFIWDDDAHVTPAVLRSLHGLWRIWFEPGATPQYYPVLCSAFWLEHHWWGGAAAGYHLLNVALHAGAACLLFCVLRRLALPGAHLAAAFFAFHPVCVESVAWISEQKNTLSAVFYLAAALAYLRFDRGRGLGWYGFALGLFGLALLSKSVTASLPAALLVVFWWKRGRLSWRADVLPLMPWLALGAAAGAMTAWMERTIVGASGAGFELGGTDRFLVAGRAVWFYLEKIFWPANLMFIYPRWTITARDWAQYLFPAAGVIALVGFWAFRKRARGPLASALLYVGTLFPALGFINLFPFLYSYVADHFQYLAAAALLSSVAAFGALAARRLSPSGQRAAQASAVAIVAALAALTWRQCAMYADSETLWRMTISRNPQCWMAYNNLGSDLLIRGRAEEAIASIQVSLKIAPGNAAAYVNLGDALRRLNRTEEALAQYERALALEPNNVVAHTNFATALLLAGRVDAAIAHYQRALAIKPDYALAHTNLGDAYFRTGRMDEAKVQYQQALVNDPDDVEAHTNLGAAALEGGHPDEAINQLRQALEIDPQFTIAYVDLGNAYIQSGRLEAAVAQYRRALELEPASPAIHNNLGYGLLQIGRVDEAIGHFQQALVIDPNDADARRNLRDALLRKGPRNQVGTPIPR